jgi:hypothetical protein
VKSLHAWITWLGAAITRPWPVRALVLAVAIALTYQATRQSTAPHRKYPPIPAPASVGGALVSYGPDTTPKWQTIDTHDAGADAWTWHGDIYGGW